jgi:preprotein translocase subunit SecD
MKNVYTKLGIILFVTILFILLAVPPKEKIKLGLDLKGGIHLVLKVQTDDAVKAVTNQAIMQMENLLKDKKINFSKIKRVGVDSFSVEGYDSMAEQQITAMLKTDFPDWNYSLSVNKITVNMKVNVKTKIKDQAVEQAKETIRNRIDQFGVAEPVIQREGLTGQSERILVELPGVEDPGRVKNLIKSTAVLELKLVLNGPFGSKEKLLEKYNGKVPEDAELVPGITKDGSKEYYLLKKVAAVSGMDLKDAKVGQDKYGAPAVSFRLKREGAKKFERFTRAHKGERLAIVLDNIVQSAPTINDVIYDSGIIEGHFTYDDANDLALKLRSGSLPASILYLEERTIGPSLGADSIRKGLKAMLIGFFFVVFFMLFYYKLSGLNAVIALFLNIVLIMGALAYFKATLTLPGMAGIILTIGMSVDANVLIFERIREDLRLGKTPKAAIDEGFRSAFITIFDANITTVIAAVFLFQFGTGPIKGFAITLIIGILASMFTAVYVSRAIFELYFVLKKRVDTLSI